MKKLMICSVLFASVMLAAGNLLPNGNFQKGLEHWKMAGWQKGTTAANGKNSIILTRTSDPDGGGALNSDLIPVKGGEIYDFETEMRVKAGGGRFYVNIYFLDAKGKTAKRYILFRTGTDTKGKFILNSEQVKAPDGAVSAQICCYITGIGEVEYRNLFFGAMTPEFKEKNLIPDADFQMENGKFRSWRSANWQGQTEIRPGEKSLILKRMENANFGGAVSGSEFAVQGGKEYGIADEMRIASQPKSRYYIIVDFYDANGKTLARPTVLQSTQDTKGKFRQFSTKITAPAKAVSAKLYCAIVGLGEVEFRNLFFGEVADLPKISARSFLPSSKTPGNDFLNADFKETGADGKPKHWTIQSQWSTASLYQYRFDNGTLTIEGGKDRHSAGGVLCDDFPLDGDKYYHLCANIQNTNVTGHSNISLQFFDVGGKALGSIIGLSQWTKDQPFYRQHHVFKTPKDCAYVRILFALRGTGKTEFKELSLTSETPDYKGNPAKKNIVLNSSFEEADLDPDFLDCFTILSGKAAQVTEAFHGFHALKLDPGAVVGYGKSPTALTVDGKKLCAHLAVKGAGSAEVRLDFTDAQGRKLVPAQIKINGKKDFNAEKFTIAIPPNAAFASLKLANTSDAPVIVDALYLGKEEYKIDYLPLPVPVVPHVVSDAKAKALPRSEVKNFQGIPTWFIDGKPVVNSLYTFRIVPGALKRSIDYHCDVARTGEFPVYVIGGAINIDEVGPGSIEEAFQAADFQIRLTMSAVPDARFLLWTQQYPSRAFAKQYPTELGIVEDVDQGFAKKIPGYSYGSEIWGRFCARSLEQFIEKLRHQPYGDRIVAVMPGFGNFGENNYGHIDGKYYLSPHDFSPAMTNFFQKFLFAYLYGGDAKALSEAWNRHKFNFTDATVPTILQREPRLQGNYPDPVRQRQTIDYARCESFSILHRVLQQCRMLKEYSGGKLFTASEIGYLGGRYHHREMMPMLESPYIDAFGPAPGYTNRGAGDDIPDNAPSASLRAHNKIMLFQSDVRSHCAGGARKSAGETNNAEESVNVYLREIGKYLITGSLPYHWTFSTWYNDPQIMDMVGRFNNLMELSAHFPRQSTAEIAVVLDPLSLSVDVGYTYRRHWKTATAQLYLNRSLEWHRLGANYDLLLLDDLLNSPVLDRYKVVILDGVCALSETQRKAIETKLYCSNRTVIWVYTAGIFRADGTKLSADDANSSISGFQLKGVSAPEKDDDHRALKLGINVPGYGLAGNMRDKIYGGFIAFNPKNHSVMPPEEALVRYQVTPSADIQVLGTYADGGAIGAAKRKLPHATTIFWGSTICDNAIMRRFIKEAGVHCYTDKPAVVYANTQFIAVHAREAGKYEITLPRKAEIVRDLFSGKIIAKNTGRFTWDFAAKSTLLAYFGEKKAFDKAKREVDAARKIRKERNEAERPKYVYKTEESKAVPAEFNKPYPLARGGFINHWLLLGPFPRTRKPDGFDFDYLGNEAALKPSQNQSFDAVFDATLPENIEERSLWYHGKPTKEMHKRKWMPYAFPLPTQKNIGNFVPFRFHERIVYYVACTVISPEEQKVLIAIGSDDGHKAYLNGKLVNQFITSARSMEPDSDCSPVTLRKGRNSLLLKVTQGGGGYGHALRFLDPATLKPVTNLTVELEK